MATICVCQWLILTVTLTLVAEVNCASSWWHQKTQNNPKISNATEVEMFLRCQTEFPPLHKLCKGDDLRCEGKCGLVRKSLIGSSEHCSCDPYCPIYKDCCPDFYTACPVHAQQLPLDMALLTESEKSCIWGSSVIASCKNGQYLEEDDLLGSPVVTQMQTGIAYKNRSVYLCNHDDGEEMLVPWKKELFIASVMSVDKLKVLLESGQVPDIEKASVVDEPPPGVFARPCYIKAIPICDVPDCPGNLHVKNLVELCNQVVSLPYPEPPYEYNANTTFLSTSNVPRHEDLGIRSTPHRIGIMSRRRPRLDMGHEPHMSTVDHVTTADAEPNFTTTLMEETVAPVGTSLTPPFTRITTLTPPFTRITTINPPFVNVSQVLCFVGYDGFIRQGRVLFSALMSLNSEGHLKLTDMSSKFNPQWESIDCPIMLNGSCEVSLKCSKGYVNQLDTCRKPDSLEITYTLSSLSQTPARQVMLDIMDRLMTVWMDSVGESVDMELYQREMGLEDGLEELQCQDTYTVNQHLIYTETALPVSIFLATYLSEGHLVNTISLGEVMARVKVCMNLSTSSFNTLTLTMEEETTTRCEQILMANPDLQAQPQTQQQQQRQQKQQQQQQQERIIVDQDTSAILWKPASMLAREMEERLKVEAHSQAPGTTWGSSCSLDTSSLLLRLTLITAVTALTRYRHWA